MNTEIRHLSPPDMGLIAAIDRSEHMAVEYSMAEGRLTSRPVDLVVPTWDPVGTGEYSVAGVIEYWKPVVTGGASFYGAFTGDEVLGLAIVDGAFEPGMAWLAFLYVSRPYRRMGVASALWAEAMRLALQADAASLYVSAIPSGSAVGFYLSRGCEPVGSVHPVLYEKEPDDIHLTCRVR